MISWFEIFTFFEDQKSLIDRGEKAVAASDIQMFDYNPGNSLIISKVQASMRDRLYNMTISLDDGKIRNYHCECAKGNDKCHHMAAVLIYAAKHISSTDIPCHWRSVKAPTKEKTSEQLFGEKDVTVLKVQPTEDDKAFFYNYMSNTPNDNILVWLMSPEPSITKHPLGDIMSFDEIKKNIDFSATSDKRGFLLDKLKLSNLQIDTLFNATTGQRNNPLWGIYRKGRITASNFGLVLKAISNNSFAPSLFTTLKGEFNLDKVRAVQWGICHEEDGIKLFEELNNIMVKKGGIYFHESGVLGCSPDGLIQIDDILEVKCPFTKANKNILHDLCSGKWFLKAKNVFNGTQFTSCVTTVYEFNSSDVTFNMQHPQGHKYHHQVQGMLHLMKKKGVPFSRVDTKCVNNYKIF